MIFSPLINCPKRKYNTTHSFLLQVYTGDGERAVLGTSNITEGLRKDDSLITEPARDLALKLARDALALSMDW